MNIKQKYKRILCFFDVLQLKKISEGVSSVPSAVFDKQWNTILSEVRTWKLDNKLGIQILGTLKKSNFVSMIASLIHAYLLKLALVCYSVFVKGRNEYVCM